MSSQEPARPNLEDLKQVKVRADPDENSKKTAYSEAREAEQRKKSAEAEALGQLLSILQNLGIDQAGETSARQGYFRLLPYFVGGWLIILAAIVILDGAFSWFIVDPEVLVTLIGGTAAGMIGVFGTVIAYLFTRKAEQIEFYRLVINKLTSTIPAPPAQPPPSEPGDDNR